MGGFPYHQTQTGGGLQQQPHLADHDRHRPRRQGTYDWGDLHEIRAGARDQVNQHGHVLQLQRQPRTEIQRSLCSRNCSAAQTRALFDDTEENREASLDLDQRIRLKTTKGWTDLVSLDSERLVNHDLRSFL